MRRKDWADKEADEFYDILANSDGDDSKVVEQIATKLRAAFRSGLGQKMKGVTYDEVHEQRSTYYVTVRRPETSDDRRAAQTFIDESNLNGCKFTWNGAKSVKAEQGG